MKRSSSTPNIQKDNVKVKKFKSNDEHPLPNTQDYLQLVLSRIVELQREINDGVYVTEETSDLDESDSEDDIMKEVLTKVFKDLPGTSKAVTSIIESTSKPSRAQLKVVQSKSIQLSGFEVCRNVAVNFVKNVTQLNAVEIPPADVQTYNAILLSGMSLSRGNLKSLDRRCSSASPTEFEVKKRMLANFDLHLATKQRDYTARLMRE